MAKDEKPSCGMGQARKITPTTADVGKQIAMFAMGRCHCKSCCRRLTLFANGPNPDPLLDNWVVKAFARVTFGIKEYCIGANVEVDFKKGVVLDLPGDYVNVILQIEEVVGTPIERTFGAFVACCGAGAARGIATRTLLNQTIAATGAASFIIPPFAYAVDFASKAPTAFFAATTTALQLGSGLNGFPQTVLDTFVGNSTNPRFFPWRIVGGAEVLVISNDAGTPIDVEPVFYIGV